MGDMSSLSGAGQWFRICPNTDVPLSLPVLFPYGARGGGLAKAMGWSKLSHDGNILHGLSDGRQAARKLMGAGRESA